MSRTISISLLFVVLAVGSLSCRTGRVEHRPAVTPPSRVHLPAAAREVLRGRMQGHAEGMTMLFWSMLFLDDGATERIAEVLASEPRMARPMSGGDDTLNASIPDSFFDLEEELFANARKLTAAAANASGDPAQVAAAYGELAATCVKCHAKFMYEPPEEQLTLR